uniref:Uncharacterized protein n=1 Tax=Periophthalmus magnuspinnatus TaxID=409849 RepID=A0A3B4B776_9GOBI
AVVDLRWGLRTSPSVEHDSCELFLHEIQTSKRISVIPAFVVLLGNRYGHRALPRLISEKHFEAFSSKLSKNTDGLKLLSQWYLKDANAVPPTYVLQPITAHLTQLLTLLRNTATSAQSAGELHPEERQRYYTSGQTEERELDLGLWSDGADSSSLVFVREIPHQKVREGPKRFAKFMDLTADGLMDAEAQTLLTSLKARLYSGPQKILNLHCVELSKGAIDPKRKEHAQYLESLCEQFVSQVKTRIEETQKLDLTALTTEEVSRHVSASVELCKDFQGREGLLGKLCLTMWESTNERHAPIVVHGELGMGKTLLLCKLAQEMRSVLENRAAVVVRLLTLLHPQKYSVENMLRSLCCQICLAFGLAPPTSLTADAHLVRFFLNVLEQVSQQGNNLLLILDDVDRLADKNGKVRWLPYELPPNVHLVVSMETKSEAFARMRLRMETLENFFEVERLGAEDGEMMAESYLRSQNRTLAQEQKDFVLKSFEKSGSPLHLRLMLSLGKRWSSFTPLAELRLAASAQEMTSLLLHTMEERHGRELTAAALGYIALGREGLLECELRDVLSLDDDVIKEVYKHFLPPSPSLIRFPPLLWAGLKYDLTEHLTERWTNGIATIVFKNRRFSESVSSRYLTSDRKGRALKILAEFFLGRWSGKLKPVALPGLSLVLPDRKVPPQPLWFGAGLANVRKLQELPFHLLQAGLWEELKQEVISKKHKSIIYTLDLDQSWRIMDCVETKLIRDVLILIKPSLDYLDGNMEMTLFYSELLSRLRSLAPLYPALIGQLCSQCETWLLSCTEPILIPQTSFLQPPGGALTHTLTGLQGDVCVEEELVVAGSDDGVIGVWSIPDAQLLHTLLGHTVFMVLTSCYNLHILNHNVHLKPRKKRNKSTDVCVRKLWCPVCHSGRVTVGVTVGACHCGRVTGGVSLWACHSGRVTVGVSLWACHCGRVTGGVSLWACHSGRVTVGVSLWACHCGRVGCVTVGVSLWACHSGRVTGACLECPVCPQVWSITTGALLDSLCGLDAPVSSLSLLSDLIVSASSSSTAVKLWTLRYDTSSPGPTRSNPDALSAGGVSERMAVSVEVSCLEVAQSKRLLLCGLLSGTVFIYPLTQPEETLCIPPPESLSRVRALTLSPSERLLGVAYDDQLCLFTLTSRDCFPAVQGPDSRLLLGLLHGPLTCCGLLNDQRFIYGTSCGEVRLHDFRSGSGSVLEAHRSRVSCVTVSNWESHALIGSDDTTQRLYSLRPTRLQHSMDYKVQGRPGGVLCAAFSDSDQFVFTGSRDRTIKVWGVSTGKLLLVQFVYFPVVRMVTYRNGFVALSKQGTIIRETFRCPDHISPDYNPLRTVRAQYRVTSNPDDPRDPCGAEEQGRSHSTQGAELHEFNPAHLSLMDVMKSKPSPTCVLL